MTGELTIATLIGRMRERFTGFNGPATAVAVERMASQAGGPLPAALLDLYRDHEGSSATLEGEAGFMPARLMPLAERADEQRSLDKAFANFPTLGPVAWFWTDDNSNYAGVLTDSQVESIILFIKSLK